MISKVATEMGSYSEEDQIQKASAKTQEIWQVFRSKIEDQFEVNFNATKFYISVNLHFSSCSILSEEEIRIGYAIWNLLGRWH